MSLESEVHKLILRYRSEIRELERLSKGLPLLERRLNHVHANVKEACANELRGLLDKASYKQVGT